MSPLLKLSQKWHSLEVYERRNQVTHSSLLPCLEEQLRRGVLAALAKPADF